MRRNFIYSLAATFITAALTLGSFTACSNEDMVAEKQNTTQAQTYTVSIPASMDDDAETRAVTFDAGGTENPTAISSFKTSDKIYVYNQKKDAMLTGYLTPSADGKTCDLEGTLTGDIAAGDELVLLYNLSNYDSDKTLCNFDYDSQDGTPAGVTDGAMATVTVDSYTGSGVLTTTTTAHFQNVQSMFRFQFTSNGTPVNVKSLAISSKNNALSNFYKPLDAGYKFCTDIPVTLSSATTNPIYVALCIKESVAAGDVLTFEVVDADNKLYTTTKDAPSTGFVNGKYYYNSSAIDLGASVLQLVKPTLSRSDGGKDSELADVGALRFFEINSPSLSGAGAGTGINMSISGTSTGYCFDLHSEAGNTINISGLTAIYDDEYDCICSFESLTLNISGDNTITCKNYGSCVSAFNFSPLCNLKLSGNGTLTVTSDKDNWCGLYGTNYSPDNNDYDETAEIDVSTQLATTGYTVTRSARTDNDADNDGTPESYTWTYTVKPAYLSATAGDIGKVIGANGIIYDDAAAATAASTTAEAMIAFVGKIDGVCEHGLAISLTDVYEYNATFAEATGDVIISSWATYHPIAGGTWRLPSEADWQRMMWGYYTESPTAIDISTFQSNLGDAGGTALVNKAYYWTSTGIDTENAKTVLYGNPYAGIQNLAKSEYCHVRACLAF